MSTSNTLYDYLEQSGVLATASPDEIQCAKKEYWKLKRKAWRKQQRLRCKSCTVFFTPSEHRFITNALTDDRKNVTGFVKRAALNAAIRTQAISKERIGKVREALYTAYGAIEKSGATPAVLEILSTLEENILFLIQ